MKKLGIILAYTGLLLLGTALAVSLDGAGVITECQGKIVMVLWWLTVHGLALIAWPSKEQ